MTRKTWLWLSLALGCLSGWVLSFPGQSEALSTELENAFQYNALSMHVEEPKFRYRLGGKLKDHELDCSLFIDEVEQRSDIIDRRKGGERTQAWRIERGLDQYDGDAVRDGIPHVGDLLCVRMPANQPGRLERPDDISHVGGIIRVGDEWRVIDATGTAGGIRVGPYRGWWKTWVPPEGWRRLWKGES